MVPDARCSLDVPGRLADPFEPVGRGRPPEGLLDAPPPPAMLPA